MEALICAAGCRRTCAVNCRRSLLSCCVGACLFVGEDVREGRCVAVGLVWHRGGGGRGWLDVWDFGSSRRGIGASPRDDPSLEINDL